MVAGAVPSWFTPDLPWFSGWLREVIITLGLVALALLLGRAVRTVWNRILLPVARRTRTQLDVALLSRTEVPLAGAVTFLLLYVGARRLAELPFISGTLSGRILDGVFYTLAVLSVTRLAVAAADGLAGWYLTEVAYRTSSPLDEQFVPVITKISAIAAYFIAATVILDRFGVNVTALITTAGVASLALALAAQDTLGNMFAGFTILLDRSYRVGDRIQLPDGTLGDVHEIGLRTTKILSFDNELIVVPNREMASARIVNQSYPDLRVKVRPRVGVAYGTDLEKAKKIFLEVCLAHPKVLKDPPPGVYFTDFGDSSLNLLGICWIADYRDRFKTLDELNMALKKRFEEEGIEIPFPQRDLHVRSLPTFLNTVAGQAQGQAAPVADKKGDGEPESTETHPHSPPAGTG